MDSNPYAPPQAPLDGSTPLEREPATIDRRAHLQVERSLQSYGSVMVFVGNFGLLFSALGLLVGGLLLGLDPAIVGPGTIGIGVMSGGLLWLGLGLRARRPSARIPATVLAVLMLPSFPVLTVVGIHLLRQLWSEKGKRVFQPDYEEVIAATPHVVYRSSRRLMGVLVLLIASLVALVLRALLM